MQLQREASLLLSPTLLDAVVARIVHELVVCGNPVCVRAVVLWVEQEAFTQRASRSGIDPRALAAPTRNSATASRRVGGGSSTAGLSAAAAAAAAATGPSPLTASLGQRGTALRSGAQSFVATTTPALSRVTIARAPAIPGPLIPPPPPARPRVAPAVTAAARGRKRRNAAPLPAILLDNDGRRPARRKRRGEPALEVVDVSDDSSSSASSDCVEEPPTAVATAEVATALRQRRGPDIDVDNDVDKTKADSIPTSAALVTTLLLRAASEIAARTEGIRRLFSLAGTRSENGALPSAVGALLLPVVVACSVARTPHKRFGVDDCPTFGTRWVALSVAGGDSASAALRDCTPVCLCLVCEGVPLDSIVQRPAGATECEPSGEDTGHRASVVSVPAVADAAHRRYCDLRSDFERMRRLFDRAEAKQYKQQQQRQRGRRAQRADGERSSGESDADEEFAVAYSFATAPGVVVHRPHRDPEARSCVAPAPAARASSIVVSKQPATRGGVTTKQRARSEVVID